MLNRYNFTCSCLYGQGNLKPFARTISNSGRLQIHQMEMYRSGHNELDSKSSCPQGHVGSNPTVSVIRGISFSFEERDAKERPGLRRVFLFPENHTRKRSDIRHASFFHTKNQPQVRLLPSRASPLPSTVRKKRQTEEANFANQAASMMPSAMQAASKITFLEYSESSFSSCITK